MSQVSGPTTYVWSTKPKRIGNHMLTAALAWTTLSWTAAAPPGSGSGGEANLVLPDLGSVSVMGGVSGTLLLGLGLVVCVLGLGFGMLAFVQLRRMPVHTSMLEVSELIYATCKTYLVTQGKLPHDAVGVHRRR